MTVDLRTCVPGQKVRLRDGRFVRYDSKNQDTVYPHLVDGISYTDDGYCYSCREEDDDGVVRILQLDKPEAPKSDKHPSIAWWESCPWITDRKPTEEDSDEGGRVMIKPINKSSALTTYWLNVKLGDPWVHRSRWQRPTLTDREQALQLLDDHRDGWRPTPEQWHIIRKGLEAS